MMTDIGESFVNYALVKDTRSAHRAGVFEDMGDDSEDEDRHISELERRMSALDEKETYITVKTLINTHKQTFIKTLEYLQKEGKNKK